MQLKNFVALLFVMLLGAGVARAQEQAGDEDVRGSFLTSRATVSVGVGDPSANTGGQSTSRRRTRRKPASSNGRETGRASVKVNGTGGSGTASTKGMTSSGRTGATTSGTTGPVKALSSAPIALGYTLYMRDANGDAVRVDPSREFHTGDRVRILLEANTDSYLYVFHTENGSQPEMVYPDARLDEGENFVEAHVPTEIPSSAESDESLRWFTFYGQPATERLYIVLTREPLPVVPTGENLVSYCQANKNKCPWRPMPDIWAQVQREANARVLVTKEKNYGQAETTREHEAATRGFGLDQSAPAPSVIRMNVTSNAGVLVTALDLVHK